MRILFLTQILPYPPDAGPRIKTWNVLRYLAGQGHQITLLSYLRPEEAQHLPAVQALCAEVVTVPIRRSRLADLYYAVRSLFSGRPFLIERDDLPAMRHALRDLLARSRFDSIHADQLTMTQFALLARRFSGSQSPAIVFDAHNATWAILDRLRRTSSRLLRPALTWEMRSVRRYEGMLVQAMDHTLAVSEIDRQNLLQAAGSPPRSGLAERILTIPIAVDISEFSPVTRQAGSVNILTLGTLRYPPNAEGIRWFLYQVFPLVLQALPSASLTIIGKDPPEDFLAAARSHPEVKVTGYVPDLVPHLQQAALMVVPVLTGSGMRVRLLEAFSRAVPVVTTTIGLEGIDARPGRDVLVADTPPDFAAAVLRLLQDPAFAAELGRSGRTLAVERYSWQAALCPLDLIYPPSLIKSS